MGSSSALARTWTSPQPGRAEAGLIGLHDPGQTLHLGLVMQENQPSEDAVEPVDGVAVEPQQKGRLGGFDVQTEAPHDV